jgi:hypothetical protein
MIEFLEGPALECIGSLRGIGGTGGTGGINFWRGIGGSRGLNSSVKAETLSG